ncbi:hypothetical protein TNCV_379741 [Trichonephila clavipes]|nr:hypothetical protein TNCV_379741 [Trichonephila clavipes]
MSWLLYQLVYNPACLVVPGGAWMGSCIAVWGLFRGHYWLLTLGQALPNWSSENQKEFSSSFLKKFQNKSKIGGEPKSVKRLRSGDLLIETTSALQTQVLSSCEIIP